MNLLFELEDKKWFPPYLRRMQMEYIGWLVEAFGLCLPVAPVLREALEASGQDRVVDLGSGAGNPVYSLARLPLLQEIPFTLTDLYPHPVSRRASNVFWYDRPVDARSKPAELKGLVTLFNAFHHFSADEKRAILERYREEGILVVEWLQPTLWVFLKILCTTTIGQVLLCPFVRPFRWDRLLFTWILPINLLTVTWDGLVSVLRSESAERLRSYASDEGSTRVQAATVRHPFFLATITYLYQVPNTHESH